MPVTRDCVSQPTGPVSTPGEQPALFLLDDLHVSRGGRVVLDGLTAELAPGSTAVAGPSGAGKSTLLRLLNRLADPVAGTVRYRGRDLRNYDVLALRRTVSLVPQLPALLDSTVAENVAYGPKLADSVADVPEALTLAGLPVSFARRRATELSVGEQQRVMLARALALKPEVLLLDEPTSALDAAARTAIEHALLHLREHLDVSYVLVTHDEAQAQRLCDRLIRLRDGRAYPPRAGVPSVP
jgi:ABC-type sulfate/molybdate transport systems ATPase subunit